MGFFIFPKMTVLAGDAGGCHPLPAQKGHSSVIADGMLAACAGPSRRGQPGARPHGGLRLVFYGRVFTEDWQES